jgi:hypothetical protein
MNEVICFDPFISGPWLHRHKLDVIAVKNVTHHDLPVAFAGPDRKFPGEFCIKLPLVDQYCINKMSSAARTCRCYTFIFLVRSHWVLRGVSYILETLIHVSHGSGRCQFQMFVDCLFSQTWPSYEMSVLRCLQKGILCGAELGVFWIKLSFFKFKGSLHTAHSLVYPLNYWIPLMLIGGSWSSLNS